MTRLLVVIACCLLLCTLSALLLLLPMQRRNVAATGDAAGRRPLDLHIQRINSDRSLHKDVNTKPLVNPFPSSSASSSSSSSLSCENRLFSTRHPQGVGVIFVVHNKKPSVVIQSIRSVLANSEGYSDRMQIILVDDHSSHPIKRWEEWKSITSFRPIKVITLQERKGYVYAKDLACQQLKSLGGIDHIVFLEVGSIVNAHWLDPIIHTLHEHPNSLVYPAIDIFDDREDSFYQSGNVIASFDWSLRLIWEDLDDFKSVEELKLRHPLIASVSHSSSDAVYSPALPSIFAVRFDTFESLGGFSSVSSMFSVFAPDNIELSLRSWLCGSGGIIRQPCSRVAIRRKIRQKDRKASKASSLRRDHHVIVDIFEGIGSEAGMHAEDEYTQFDADRDALTLAERWMGGEPYAQYVLNSRIGGGRVTDEDPQSRGTGRFPYPVTPYEDARHPSKGTTSGHNVDQECRKFPWFLNAVNPGLVLDLPFSEMHFMDTTQQKSLQVMMKPLLEQYKSSKEYSPSSGGFSPIKSSYQLPSPQDKAKENRLEQEQEMAYQIRDEQLCENVNEESCEKERASNGCVANVGYNMFHCPKACGFCSEENELCIDFYLNKCPKFAAEGRCTDSEHKQFMEVNCRPSCNLCTQIGSSPKPKPKPKPKKKPEPAPREEFESTYINPYRAQEQWRAGQNEDVVMKNPCFLSINANGELLDHIHIDSLPPSRPGNRIFCGTYTHEANHDTNVRYVKQTWAKKCDGWLAFSTVDDASLPSVNIRHEGEESWNNMWQKIRFIWKYVHKHFRNDFDWFLLGGDDMFYIVENLKKYLESPEIVKAREQQKGLYLGRRFFPPNQVVFNSGGAGYILDRVALDVLVSHIDGPPCMPHQKGFWEDVNTASCLQKVEEHIMPFDTRDEHGRERFHPFQPANHLTYRIPKNPDWYAKYNPDLKVGLECCSSNSVSFHYSKGQFMEKLNNYIYHCPSKKDVRGPL